MFVFCPPESTGGRREWIFTGDSLFIFFFPAFRVVERTLLRAPPAAGNSLLLRNNPHRYSMSCWEQRKCEYLSSKPSDELMMQTGSDNKQQNRSFQVLFPAATVHKTRWVKSGGHISFIDNTNLSHSEAFVSCHQWDPLYTLVYLLWILKQR